MKHVKAFIYGTLPFYYLSLFKRKSPELEYRKYFMTHGYTRNPYPFAEKYAGLEINVHKDEENGLLYVIHRNGRKLYYPRAFHVDAVKRIYKAVLIEQAPEHPHHYVDSLDEFKGKVLLDIGSAEGLTSLDAVEEAKKIYLFECNPSWIEALKATFAPWKEKVEIVEKYVSLTCSERCITLDEFFKDKPTEDLFLKMDIEGAECDALQGAKQLFAIARNMEFAICTYHRANDEKEIKAYLSKFNCTWKTPKDLFYVKHNFRVCLLRGRS